jgi:uncharacterized membrane protein YecN with MAPEG domain
MAETSTNKTKAQAADDAETRATTAWEAHAKELAATMHVPVARIALERFMPAAKEAVDAYTDLSRTLFVLAYEQLEHQARAVQKMSEFLPAQSAFMHASMTRWSAAAAGQIDFAGRVSHALGTNGREVDKAA